MSCPTCHGYPSNNCPCCGPSLPDLDGDAIRAAALKVGISVIRGETDANTQAIRDCAEDICDRFHLAPVDRYVDAIVDDYGEIRA